MRELESPDRNVEPLDLAAPIGESHKETTVETSSRQVGDGAALRHGELATPVRWAPDLKDSFNHRHRPTGGLQVRDRSESPANTSVRKQDAQLEYGERRFALDQNPALAEDNETRTTLASRQRLIALPTAIVTEGAVPGRRWGPCAYSPSFA